MWGPQKPERRPELVKIPKVVFGRPLYYIEQSCSASFLQAWLHKVEFSQLFFSYRDAHMSCILLLRALVTDFPGARSGKSIQARHVFLFGWWGGCKRDLYLATLHLTFFSKDQVTHARDQIS